MSGNHSRTGTTKQTDVSLSQKPWCDPSSSLSPGTGASASLTWLRLGAWRLRTIKDVIASWRSCRGTKAVLAIRMAGASPMQPLRRLREIENGDARLLRVQHRISPLTIAWFFFTPLHGSLTARVADVAYRPVSQSATTLRIRTSTNTGPRRGMSQQLPSTSSTLS